MTVPIAHVGHYTGLFIFGPVLLLALWLFVSDKLAQRRAARSGNGDERRSRPDDRDDLRDA